MWRCPEAALCHGVRLTACCRCVAAAVLNDAADTVEENGIQGSSTCCLVLVDTLQGRLTSANIGDSGFVLIGERCHVMFASDMRTVQHALTGYGLG